MFPIRNNIRKIVVLRPGALGDVLAVRGVIRFLKGAFPEAEVNLVAPGERGAFFRRPGWVDRAFDWERAAFSWLFSDGRETPPPALRAVFSGCDWVLAYVDPEGEAGWERLEGRLATLAPAAAKVFCPSRPDADHGEGIGEWLVRAAWAFCQRYHLSPPESVPDLPALAAARVRIGSGNALPAVAGAYLVLHPGSGSARKNWPLAEYVGLGRLLLAATGKGGEAVFSGLVVTSGEADGDLGERLAGELPGAVHVHQPELEALARVLANAKLFVGNDSGVSHLAAAVMNEAGAFPRQAAIFGHTGASVWAPPGALVLRAGVDMQALSAEAAGRAILPLCRA